MGSRRLSRLIERIRCNDAGRPTEEELRLREQVRQRINSMSEEERRKVEQTGTAARTNSASERIASGGVNVGFRYF